MSSLLHFDDQQWIDADGHAYDWNIKAHIDTLAEHMERNPLISNLLERGKITLQKTLGKPIGIAVDNEFFVVGENQNQLSNRIRFLGALTEGCHSFHYYLPSPKSRFNYYLQAQHCAKAIVRGQTHNV